MPSKGSPIRNVRVPDDVWLPARAKAEAEGVSLSALMVEALRRYVKRPPRSR